MSPPCDGCGGGGGGWHGPIGARAWLCGRCWARRAASTERHPNVFMAGALRCIEGGARRPPYQDWRNARGRVTFARYWRNLWLRGWDAAREEGYGPMAPEVEAWQSDRQR